MPSHQNMSRLTSFGSYSRNLDLRTAQPLLGKGGWTLKRPFSQKLIYFSYMSSSKFRPLRGARDLWKSCSKCEAESIKHLIQRCLRANTAENMSYHLSWHWDLTFFVRNLFFCTDKSCSVDQDKQLSPLQFDTFSTENLSYQIWRFLRKSWYDDISAFERKTCLPTKTRDV